MARAQSCANHGQHIERLSRASVTLRATCYEGTAQLLSLTKLKSHFIWALFFGWTIKPKKEGKKPEYPEKAPGDELQKIWSPCLQLSGLSGEASASTAAGLGLIPVLAVDLFLRSSHISDLKPGPPVVNLGSLRGSLAGDRLFGLEVRRPPRERKVPGSNPACAGNFSESSHTSDLNIGTPVATLAL